MVIEFGLFVGRKVDGSLMFADATVQWSCGSSCRLFSRRALSEEREVGSNLTTLRIIVQTTQRNRFTG